MDLLMIYPPISVNERYARDTGDIGGDLPPLGIMQIASFLRDKGYKVGIIDAVIEDIDERELIKKVKKLKPKIIGFSALTSNFHRAIKTAERLKKALPSCLIILGGHHASIECEKTISKNKCFDFLVYGEGELTALEIVKKFKSLKYDKAKFLKQLKNIKGICFRNGKKAIKTPIRPPIENLDELPFPARDLLPMEKYIPLPNQYLRKPIINMVVIRGCPFNCSFCSNNSVFGRKIRAMSPKRVIDEIKHVKKEYGAKEISFWDDMMTVNKKWIKEFCDTLLKEKIDITWTCYSRVDTVNLEMLKHMKKAGCWNIFFGYESGSQKLLNNINKGTSLKQIELANKWCKQAGIEIRASFMLALPGETPELAQKTIEFAKKLNPDYAQFCITTPFPGTKLYEESKKHGHMKNDYSEYNIWNPVFLPYGYKSREEIEKLEKKAVRQFYFRPTYIINRIRKIRSFEDIKRYAKGLRFLFGFLKQK